MCYRNTLCTGYQSNFKIRKEFIVLVTTAFFGHSITVITHVLTFFMLTDQKAWAGTEDKIVNLARDSKAGSLAWPSNCWQSTLIGNVLVIRFVVVVYTVSIDLHSGSWEQRWWLLCMEYHDNCSWMLIAVQRHPIWRPFWGLCQLVCPFPSYFLSNYKSLNCLPLCRVFFPCARPPTSGTIAHWFDFQSGHTFHPLPHCL